MATAPAPSNQTTVRIIKEVAGAVPGTGTLDQLLVGTFEANAPTTRAATQNIAANGLVPNNAAMSQTGSGSVNFDMTTFGHRGIEEGVGGPYVAAYLHSGSGITAAATGNNLVLASGTWTAGLLAGDFVIVVGFANGVGKNGAKFLARVLSAPSGVNLPLDPAYKTLVNEAAVGTLTVYHDGYQDFDRQINDTYAAEKFNQVSDVGDLYHNIMFSGWNEDWSLDSYVKVAVSFRLSSREGIAAPIALATTVPSQAAGPEWSSGPNVGAREFPEWGLGFRYGGVLMDDVGLQGLKCNIDNPAKGSRALDSIGDVGQYRDERAVASVEWMAKRDGTANAETILADCEDTNAVASIGWGYVDGDGAITYYHWAEMQPSQETTDSVKSSGEGEIKVTYMARDAPIYGYRRKTVFLPR